MQTSSVLTYPAEARKAKPYTAPRSLSTYFPAGTQYFYGYPAGETLSFMNHVTPITEELIAARAYSCAGPNVSIISFPATQPPALDQSLVQALSLPQPGLSQQHFLLPSKIDITTTGNARNQALMTALLDCTSRGKLIMAQPFIDTAIQPNYQISPALTTWLNDKKHLEDYIDRELLPKRLATYESGSDFARAVQTLSLPFVIKASSSSAGDGVYICHTTADVRRAVTNLEHTPLSIIVEQYIETVSNYGVHFGIPHNRQKPIDILGVNQQLDLDGKFLGGFIESRTIPKELQGVIHYLETTLLPAVRAMGWYGVGGFDVLVDKTGRTYFIDSNFRMTALTPYHFMAHAKLLKLPLISFSGSFMGSQADFEHALLPIAGSNRRRKLLQLIALSHHDNIWYFNAACVGINLANCKQTLQLLLDIGIVSAGLEQLIKIL